jgi:hypothetical protein
MRELASAPTFLIKQGMRTAIAVDKSCKANVAQTHEQGFSVTMEPNQGPQQNTTTRDMEDTHMEGTITDVVDATRTMPSSSTSDGELLAQLAATIVGNEMIIDQQREISDRADETRVLWREFNKSREVTVTGPKGVPVYAIGCVEDDGYSDNVTLDGTEARCSSIEDLLAAEIHVGGIIKARLVHHNFNYILDCSVDSLYRPATQVLTVDLPFCICKLLVSLGPVSEQRYRSLPEDFESSELEGHLPSLFDSEDGHRVFVTFDEARFFPGMLAFDIMDQEDANMEDTATDVAATTRTMPPSSTSDGELLAQLTATIIGNEMLIEKKRDGLSC